MPDQEPQKTLFEMYEEWGKKHDYRVADSVQRFKMYAKHMGLKSPELERRNAMRELPRYICHKRVQAFKITLSSSNDGVVTELYGDNCISVTVNDDYIHKHKPEMGGYYVRYEDGYESYSPAEPFEKGYTLIDPEE